MEAISFLLLLFVAVPLKYLAHEPLAVRVIGPLHGLAFVAYIWLVIESAAAGAWRRPEALRLFVGTLLPFGTIFNEKLIRERLPES